MYVQEVGHSLAQRICQRSGHSRHARNACVSRLTVFLVCITALTGCLRPYEHSVFDPPTAQLPGITSQWTATSGGDVRVLFVHGMCTHTEANWITTGWDVAMRRYFPRGDDDGHTSSPSRSSSNY